MKKNTRKILVSLYSPTDKNPVRIKASHAKVILPNLTDGGRRSLLYVLKENGLIFSERVLGKTSISLTSRGRQEIEAQFPALSSKWDTWQGSWDCLIFVKAPKSDKQFRYLRTLLVGEGAVSISRGTYISPFSFSPKVIGECKEFYRDSVLVFSVGEWKIANIRSLIVEKYGLLDVIESYSGISSDIKRLLISVTTHNRLIDRHKNDISLVYDRLIGVMAEDPGFSKYYFNEIPNVKSMIADLNSLLNRY